MFDKLFTPITIKDMTLRNRIIMPAMGTRFTEGNYVGYRFYETRYVDNTTDKHGCLMDGGAAASLPILD